MKKVVILGCENSHAHSFLNTMKNYPEDFRDLEVIGVYSDEIAECEKLRNRYGVDILEDYTSAVGKVDGVIITARNGDNHYKYAKPYIESGVPMYIDKPITNTEEEAVAFVKDLEAHGVCFTGGSTLRHDPNVLKFKEERINEVDGKTLGGLVKAPIDSNSAYGGFFFYAPHLVEIVCEMFGRNPKSVKAYKAGISTTVIFRYEDYDVTGVYTENNYLYYASRIAEKGARMEKITLGTGRELDWMYKELKEYYDILNGAERAMSTEDFLAPVFIANAIKRSIDSGEEEKVNPVIL